MACPSQSLWPNAAKAKGRYQQDAKQLGVGTSFVQRIVGVEEMV
jgi:hypothetical protein